MSFLELCNMQATLFIMILAGVILKKKGIIDAAGERNLTDLCICLVIPCNIIKSCFIEFDSSIFSACFALFVSGVAMEAIGMVLNKFLYNGFTEQKKKVLQYATVVSNGGFLGNPIAEGIYGSLGLLYASVYLIPVRVVVWSTGTSYFMAGSSMDKKKVLLNILTHPCLVSVYIGLFIMFTQLPLPSSVKSAIIYIGNCNSALTMFIVGTILAEINVFTIFDKDVLLFSILRLGLLPLVSYGMSLMLHLNATATGVSVMMAGMPAAATTAIFAARYDSDAPFATKVVILTTLLSMLTVPIWCYFVS